MPNAGKRSPSFNGARPQSGSLSDIPPVTVPAVSALSPVHIATATDEVADRLLTAIALGEFVTGERLPAEREMARLLEVSRTTVRQAIGRLRAVGIVEIRRGRSGGAYVSSNWAAGSADAVRRTLLPQWQELERLFDLRELVESMVARVAAERRTREDISCLRAALDQFARAVSAENEHAADTAIHRAVAHATGNPRIEILSRDLLSAVAVGLPIEPYRKDVYQQAYAEHAALVSAVIEGCVDDAGRIARAHFSMTSDTMRRILGRGLQERRRPSHPKRVRRNASPVARPD